MIVREEKPFSIDIRQMVGVQGPGLRHRSAWFSILDLDLLMTGHRFGERIEDFEVQNRLGAVPKRDGLLPVGLVQRNRVGQCRRHFLKSAHERLLEMGSPVLLQRFLRDQ